MRDSRHPQKHSFTPLKQTLLEHNILHRAVPYIAKDINDSIVGSIPAFPFETLTLKESQLHDNIFIKLLVLMYEIVYLETSTCRQNFLNKLSLRLFLAVG